MPEKIGHNTSEKFVFPCGKVVKILVRQYRPEFKWRIYWLENGVHIYDKESATDDNVHMKFAYTRMVSEAKTALADAQAKPLSGYVKLSFMVHVDDFSQQALDHLVNDIKAEMRGYMGVTPIRAMSERLGDKLI